MSIRLDKTKNIALLGSVWDGGLLPHAEVLHHGPFHQPMPGEFHAQMGGEIVKGPYG